MGKEGKKERGKEGKSKTVIERVRWGWWNVFMWG